MNVRKNIALVDDDRNILTSVSMLLEAEGFQVKTYSDGAAALEGLNQAPPDMAIFDIKMPRMDGMELLNRVRKTQQFPVIFLTSKDEEIDEVLGLRMGADDFIRKPFSQRLLLERIRAVLRRSDGGGPKAEGQAERIVRGELQPLERYLIVIRGERPFLEVSLRLFLRLIRIVRQDALVEALRGCQRRPVAEQHVEKLELLDMTAQDDQAKRERS